MIRSIAAALLVLVAPCAVASGQAALNVTEASVTNLQRAMSMPGASAWRC